MGKDSLRITRPGNREHVLPRAKAVAGEDVHPHSVMAGEAGRFSAYASVTPKSNRETADFTLENCGPVPNRRVLVADHLAKVAGQVHHHGKVPFRNSGDRDNRGHWSP